MGGKRRRKSSHHFTLPAEIWLAIFQLSTAASPQVLDTDIRDPFKLPPPLSEQEVVESLRESLVTKRALVRVCKAWHSMALPFLYEAIIINNRRDLVSLRTNLLDSKRRAEIDGDGVPSLGWHTKRFELARRSQTHYAPEGIPPDEEISHLSDIFHCLPNLAILIVARDDNYHPPWPSSIVGDLAASCGPALRVLRWRRSPYPDLSEWDQLLRAAPNLRILELPEAHNNLAQLQVGPHLPYLVSLEMAGRSAPYFDTKNVPAFPSLHHLAISGWNGLPSLLLTQYRDQLSSITLRTSHLENAVPIVASLCPNLRRMVIHIRFMNGFPAELPTTAHLGLVYTEESVSRHQAKIFFARLSTLNAPNLQLLRFLDRRLLDHIRYHHPKVFSQGMESLSSRQYRIEDMDGVLVFPET
ncbi:hypothetical protein JAAARDRAFT_201490 [Jaapia argillacea MUCL 33604]|uniref:F-box domain-containing protein n=1 Tax=Jaapia argillacea MUCL 33604 TaxID=933084 RepID=A0A067QAV3_9AGAM|nr:hypothetical protein JAAARDRAFT_201490 [Jaapia argillacea MUCL 33604]